MGLIGEFLKYRKTKKMLSFLEKEYGITEEMLKEYPKVIDTYKNGGLGASNSEDDKTITENNKEAFKEKSTPEDLIKMFAQEVEEFYPYGKPN